jgi:hypothetical protein
LRNIDKNEDNLNYLIKILIKYIINGKKETINYDIESNKEINLDEKIFNDNLYNDEK